MQTATPNAQPAAWQKISAFIIAVAVVGLALACGIGSSRLINEPFPGFLVLENRVIASVSLPHWLGAAHGDSLYQHVVTAVNDQPVTTAGDVYSLVAQLPPGSPVTYQLEKNGQTSQLTFHSLFFYVEDYLLLQGIYLFSGLTIALIGLVVWFLQPTAPASQALLIQCLTLGVYILTAADLYSPYWFFRLHVMCEAVYPAGFIHLALVFPVDRLRRHRAMWITFPYGVALLLGLVYESVLAHPSLYTGILFLCLSFSGLSMLVLLSGVAWGYCCSSSPLVQRRIRVIFLGVCSGFIIPAGLFLWSSSTGGEVAVNSAALPVFLFPLSLGYAIVKHDLFEIDALLKRSTYYLALTALLMLIYLSIVAVLNYSMPTWSITRSPLFTLFFTCMVVLLLNPLKDYVQRGIDRLFFRVHYNPQAVLESASTTLASTLHLEEILGCLWKTISENLGIRRGAVYLLSTDHNRYVAVYPLSAFPFSLASSSPLISILLRQKGRALSEYHVDPTLTAFAEAEGVQQAFQALDAHLIVPLRFQGNLLGMIVLGRKESGRFFSAVDIDFLSLLAHQGVLALSNARTYQELEELNKGLESKVADRTHKLVQANAQLGKTNTHLQTSLKQLEQAYQDLEDSQARLVRAEKMAAFGRLTAGIAHEVNTPLSASMTSLTLIQKLTEEYEASIGDPDVNEQDYREIAGEMKQYVSDTHQWLEKAAGYIQSLKRHSRGLERGVEGEFTLLQVLEDTERLLSHELRVSACRIVLENVSPQLMLCGDAGKLGQVFANLITNAIDAYKETEAGRGDIRIAVKDAGECLQVLVQDHAGGIAPEHGEQIFEEFFSTKLQGKGTGLGLGICRNILTNFFDGTLEVESQLGQGSTFILEIPRQRHKFLDHREALTLPAQETHVRVSAV